MITSVGRFFRQAGAVSATSLSLLLSSGTLASAQVAGESAEAAIPAGATTQPPPAIGQNAAVDSARAVRGQNLVISVITYGATEVLWERFGHDALAVRDTVTGQDYAYNWGMFDFEAPNFTSRFLTGDTRYWMQPYPTDLYNKVQYIDDNRTVRVQRLAMTAVERGAILDYVIWNSQEENKYYRYDYYQDNCATRVRDAIDRVLNGRVKAVLDTGITDMTWRSETERVTASDPFVYPGIELALGKNADRKLTTWEASFMPERLADGLATVILNNAAGNRYKLVATDTIIYQSTRVPMPIDPPDRFAMAALLGLTIAGIVAWLADSRFKALRGVLFTFAVLWYLLGGILGTALLIAGTATKHAPYMGTNTTLWQIHPLLLFGALFIPVALYRRQTTQIPRIMASIIAMFSVFGAVLQLVPMFSQKSGVVLAVMVPVHVALAIAVLRLPVVAPPKRMAPGAVPPRAGAALRSPARRARAPWPRAPRRSSARTSAPAEAL
ncbi:MAG: DUF4105 domain-containing protein, partial [Gemmatimonas sp.]